MLNLTYSIADQSFERTKSLGILNVSLNLLRRLAARPEVGALTVLANRTLVPHLPGAERVDIRRHDEAIRSRPGRILWDQRGVYAAARRAGNPWLLLPKGYASFVARPPVRLAAIVHDAMNDHYLRHYPQAVSRFEAWYFRASLRATLRRAAVVFADSDFTRAEVGRLAAEWNLPVPRMLTSGVGFDPDDVQIRSLRDAGAGPRRGLLVLASRWPHKRTALAVDFLARWCERAGWREPVTWVGSLPDGLALPDRAGWTFQPRPGNEAYARLLATHRALLFFTEYEGFGMPPVEAALAGACPVYSDIPVTREVMGGAGVAFPNQDYDGFAAAMERALRVSADEVAAWARGLLARHDWGLVGDRVVGALG